MPVALTRAGLVAERVTRAFWPTWTVLFLVLAPLMMGWHERMPLELFWGIGIVAVIALLVTLWQGARRFRWPSKVDALERVDAAMPGRPISALADTQAIGSGDSGSEGVWRAHVARMQERSKAARAVQPDLRVSSRDPYGLRYMALLVFVAALLFGSILRVGSVADMTPGGGDRVLSTGPVWEGWIEPPSYTGKPTLYLNDIEPGSVAVTEGARVTLRLYGDADALSVSESVSGTPPPPVETDEPEAPAATEIGMREQGFDVAQNGSITIDGDGGASWDITVQQDAAPTVEITGPPDVEAYGEMSLPFHASDDYAVSSGRAIIELDLEAIDRIYGLSVEPEPRDPLIVDLPMPFSGDRADFDEAMIDDFSQHPFANLPVTITMEVQDGLEQTGVSEPNAMSLPGRRFFQPVAKAVIELRRDLLWSKENASRVSDLLKAVANRPGDIIRSETSYLRLNYITRQLDSAVREGMTTESQDEIAEALWDLAVQLEDGSLADARERLRRAQERLAEAMRNGASEEEIQELMQELREAVDDYTRMLAEQQQAQNGEDGTDQPDQQAQETFEFSQDELQALMDRIQELMEEGRMAEAQELMDQLNQLMENMQVTEGEPGQQGQGQQSMQDLSETLRDQQGLSDEAFRDLQEQFGQGQQGQQGQPQDGEQPGQQAENGQGQQGEQQGEGMGQGGDAQDGRTGGENGEGGEMSLAERQRALREELNRQQGNLPNLGGDAADEARRSLDRAGEAMDGAEDALENGDIPEAIDRQAEAMDALREGIRNLGDALAENQQDQQPGQGQADGENATGRVEPQRRDPLGRQLGDTGRYGTDENLLQGEDIYRRAEELLEELRRRSSDQLRPEVERDYLERLLDRF
ncbi:TIGR02302 family protein [Pelagovum pacificum]|uniref:TIGR02302 family protein n=1 Tax=Pelagovum pacificum TaxID=2588711 RepID=A0A5C5G9Q6_9RHOB|nr:TIGR02302 family protein [Pelagovum pacificum]QQA45031.1 TIGR02302 family protein [Pelagovum pacificum]TNY31485.1 TIGR02302 family protein [Pelagovum pacificum]